MRELATETAERYPNEVGLQVAPEIGAFLTLLTRLARARTAIEVGTFTGYSSICLARGLGPGGRLLCSDVSEEWTSVARKYWEKAGLSDRIELRIGAALDTLRSLPRRRSSMLRSSTRTSSRTRSTGPRSCRGCAAAA